MSSPVAENALWALLRGRRLGGYIFRRRHAVGPFIVDFFCPARRLAVELDGGQHFVACDRKRATFFARRGIRVVRFSCDRVLREAPTVVAAIAFALSVGGR